MTRYLLTAALVTAFCVPSLSAAGGVKAGMNFATFIGGDAKGAGSTMVSRAAFSAGGYLIVPVRNMPFSLQPEALITSKGAVYKYDVYGGTPMEARYRLTYLELPVLARFDFKSRTGAKPSLLVGPSFGLKIGARGDYRTVDGGSSSGKLNNVRAFELGLALGGLLEMQTSKGAVTLEARYTRGLTKVFESVQGRTADIKNSMAAVMLGYRF